ncbi:unnamed protein product [Polarella glacialis]|uniref:Uncharacterized protein n=1 Tax=Polarella glacialis TaxID=89957 RepID=A0A813LN68_POLGL|nr:unnamed protein product [Polarella glacialis]
MELLDVQKLAWAFAQLDVQDPELFKILGHEALCARAELSAQGASSLAWSFAKLGVQDSGELFQALAEELEGRLAGELTAQGLANVAWAFGTAAGLASFARTAEQSGLFRVIAREAAGKLRTFRPKELTNLLQAFARAKAGLLLARVCYFAVWAV